MFYVFRCKDCGKWRVCKVTDINKYVFRCFNCNKMFKVKHKNDYGLFLMHQGPVYTAYEAQILCCNLNGGQNAKRERG